MLHERLVKIEVNTTVQMILFGVTRQYILLLRTPDAMVTIIVPEKNMVCDNHRDLSCNTRRGVIDRPSFLQIMMLTSITLSIPEFL